MLKVLCQSVEQVRIEVDYMPQRNELRDVPETSEEKKPEMPMLVLPVRVQVSGEVLDLGTVEFNDVSKIIGQIKMEFSQM